MGIKSNQREFHIFFNIFLVATIMNIAFPLLDLFKLIEREDIELFVDIFSLLRFSCFFAIFIVISAIKEYGFDNFYRKILENKYVFVSNIFFLIIFFVFYNFFNDELITYSTFNVFVFSIPTSILWVCIKLLENSRTVQWQKSCGTYKEYKNTFLWRFNIISFNIEKGFSRKEVIKASHKKDIYLYLISALIILVISRSINILVILILIKPLLFILDILLLSITSIQGECTGFYKKARGRGVSDLCDYIYIVTDFEKKREVKFKTEERLPVSEGHHVKVYYTLFSKTILKYY